MNLFYKKQGSGQPLLILHGLLGSSDNWQHIARKLSDRYEVFIPDLRNHGQSPHSDTHTYSSMVLDIAQFIEKEISRKVLLLGHSMGGKLAMHLSIHHTDLIQKMVVVDISPRSYKNTIDYEQHPIDLLNIFNALLSIDISLVKSRQEADDLLSVYLADRNLRAFLLKNMIREERGNYRWQMNLSVLNSALPEILSGIMVDSLQKEKVTNLSVLFLKGSMSEYVKERDLEIIKAIYPKSQVKTIEGSGHMPHIEQASTFLEEVNSFFQYPM